ncbi:hypothetical protein PtB15_11B484 [Puccinia triticina]|nr:hypothetical protein PtB15_11B484 [Puccinia triticina]
MFYILTELPGRQLAAIRMRKRAVGIDGLESTKDLVVSSKTGHDHVGFGAGNVFEQMGIVGHSGKFTPIQIQGQIPADIMNDIPEQYRDGLLVHQTKHVDHTKDIQTSETTEKNALGLTSTLQQTIVRENFLADAKYHILAKGAHVHVHVKEQGIRAPDPKAKHKFLTATATEQMEGKAKTYAAWDDLIALIPPHDHEDFGAYLAQTERDDPLERIQNQVAVYQFSRKYISFTDQKNKLRSITAPPSAEVHPTVSDSGSRKENANEVESGEEVWKGNTPSKENEKVIKSGDEVQKSSDERQTGRSDVDVRTAQFVEQIGYLLPRQDPPSNIDDPNFMQFKELKMALKIRMHQSDAEIKRFVTWINAHHKQSLGQIADDDWFPTYELFWNYATYLHKEDLKNVNPTQFDLINKKGVEAVAQNHEKHYFSPYLKELLEANLTPVERKHFGKTVLYKDKKNVLVNVFSKKGKPKAENRNPYVYRSEFAKELKEWREKPRTIREKLELGLESAMMKSKKVASSWAERCKNAFRNIFAILRKKIRNLIPIVKKRVD